MAQLVELRSIDVVPDEERHGTAVSHGGPGASPG